MTSNLFIVYRITNIVERKHYYGYKSCGTRDPKEIIGKTYYSSSSDKEFIEEQKNHPERFRYKIVARFNTKEEAFEREILLHRLFDVGRNLSFYNRSIQKHRGESDASGTTPVRRKEDGIVFRCSVDDPRLSTGELIHLNVGKIAVKDNNGKTFQVSVDDPRLATGEIQPANKGMVLVRDGDKFRSVHVSDPLYISGALPHSTKGRVPVRDSEGNTLQVSVDDPRYLSGELVHTMRDKVVVNDAGKLYAVSKDDERLISGTLKLHTTAGFTAAKDREGNTFQVSVDDPRFDSGDIAHIFKDTIQVIGDGGKIIRVARDDPRYLSGELVSKQKGYTSVQNSLGERMLVSVDDPRYLSGELFSTARGRVNVKDNLNNRFSVSVDDPRYKSGELIHVGRGMVCINNGVSNKKVEPSQLDSFLRDGWSVGRLKRKNMI